MAKLELKNPLSANFDRALQLAHNLHRRQPRKRSDVPYIAHLLAVTAIVLENGGDEDTAIAALLHDAVEDQGGKPTLDRISREFGERVARIVYECTDADGEPKPPWRFRKEQYLEALPHKSRRGRCWFPSPTRFTTAAPLCATCAGMVRRSGTASKAGGTVPFGTTTNCLRSFPGSRILGSTTNSPPPSAP